LPDEKDLNVKAQKKKTSAMEIYKKVEYIHKDKAQKYIGYRKAVYYGFFKEMPLDKKKS
jgi:hypothetical protein